MMYIIYSILINMFRMVFRLSSGWYSYYKNTIVVNYVQQNCLIFIIVEWWWHI